MLFKTKEEEAVEELKELGYRVTKIDFSEVPSAHNLKELVSYFYACRQFYNPDRKFPPSLDYTADIKIMSVLVKKRQGLGLSRKNAIQETAVLIVTLFKFEKHLKLKEPILSIRILTSAPIMNHICAYANGEVNEVNETDTDLYIDEINEIYNKKFVHLDLERADKDREVILEGLHGQGKR